MMKSDLLRTFCRRSLRAISQAARTSVPQRRAGDVEEHCLEVGPGDLDRGDGGSGGRDQRDRVGHECRRVIGEDVEAALARGHAGHTLGGAELLGDTVRSEEHTSELQSLMRISYAVFCLTKKK